MGSGLAEDSRYLPSSAFGVENVPGSATWRSWSKPMTRAMGLVDQKPIAVLAACENGGGRRLPAMGTFSGPQARMSRSASTP